MGNKKELGKGLRALLSNIDNTSAPENKEEVVKQLSSTIAEIPVNEIIPNPFQPRKEFTHKDLLELTQSIKTYGLIQPITVRKLGEQFQLISGERRWRASKLAGLKAVPAYIRVTDDQGMLEMALVENIQRAELNAIEIAISYHRLMDECDFNHEELADRVGKERSTVTNYLRLLKLAPKIQTAIKEGEISMGHARAISGVDNQNWQFQLFDEIINKKLSVRATEALVKQWKENSKQGVPKAKTASGLTPEILKIKDRLTSITGNKVDIKRNTKGVGSLTLHFRSDDDFNNLLDRFQD